jgi:hypothetical protein
MKHQSRMMPGVFVDFKPYVTGIEQAKTLMG